MVCYTTCALATGFIGSSLALTFYTRKELLQNQLLDTLDDNQKVIYKSIVEERFTALVTGTIIGLILSAIYFYLAKTNSAKPQTIICSVIAIIGITQYLYYRLVPKSQWLLIHLDKREQIDAWLEMYKYMSRRCHLGFLLGIVGYALLAWANI